MPTSGHQTAADFVAEGYAEHRDEIYRYFFSRLRDADAAADLTQDVFLAAARAASTLQLDPRPLLQWLYAVAHRRYVDEMRQRRLERGRVPYEEPIVAALVSAPEPFTATISDALRSLSPAQRSVCAARLLQGLPFAEIGEQLSVPEPACRARFHRAVVELRRQLEGRSV